MGAAVDGVVRVIAHDAQTFRAQRYAIRAARILMQRFCDNVAPLPGRPVGKGNGLDRMGVVRIRRRRTESVDDDQRVAGILDANDKTVISLGFAALNQQLDIVRANVIAESDDVALSRPPFILVNPVASVSALEQKGVVPPAAVKMIVSLTAMDDVISSSAVQGVIAAFAENAVGLVAALNHVVPLVANHMYAVPTQFGVVRSFQFYRLGQDIRPFPPRAIREFNGLNRMGIGLVGGVGMERVSDSQRLAAGFDPDHKVVIPVGGPGGDAQFNIVASEIGKTNDVPLVASGIVFMDDIVPAPEAVDIGIVAEVALQPVVARPADDHVVAVGPGQCLAGGCAYNDIVRFGSRRHFPILGRDRRQRASLITAPGAAGTLRRAQGVHRGHEVREIGGIKLRSIDHYAFQAIGRV